MKWLLRVFSALAIGWSGVQLAGLVHPVDRPVPGTVQFVNLPVDEPRHVEFNGFAAETADSATFRPGSYWNGYSTAMTGDRERLDQYRDWLFITALTATTLDGEAINKILFDLPPVRRGVLNPVANFEYGLTRSRVISDSEVLALIPAGDSAERAQHLAHVADEERKNLGRIPKIIHVVEYQIDSGSEEGTLTRRASISGEQLFSESAGYYEADVKDLPSFQAFMGKANDVTYARLIDGGLRLGGRTIAGYRGIRVEDVAAIYRSEAEQRSGSIQKTGTGFSLDPQLDFRALTAAAPFIEQALAAESRRPSEIADDTVSVLTAEDLEAVREGFEREDATPYLQVASQLCSREKEHAACNRYLKALLLQFRYQKARYDGDLMGTEVGMVFFYTDLLMKLWGLDFHGATPRPSQVDGFPNRLEMKVAAVYKDEVDQFPETRLWLGSLDKGFQIGPNHREIILGRISTRVFAVPHDFLSNSDSKLATEPHVYLRLLINWWNAHFEEVSNYEREYQRLNELIKWTQILGWLNGDGNGDHAGFLDGVEVTHSRYFPNWARANRTLTYRQWDAIGFKPRGYRGEVTEVLPLLHSRQMDHFGTPITWEGGVSGARAEELASRIGLNTEIGALARRAGIDYGNIRPNVLTTLEHVEYRFAASPSGRFSTLATINPTQRLRGLAGELRSTSVERSISRSVGGTELEERAGSATIGDLQVQRVGRDFQVGWKSRQVDAGQSLARRISTAEDPTATLLADPQVEQLVQLPAQNEFLVRTRGASGWTRIKVSPTEVSDLTPGYDARISGFGAEARDVDIAFVSEENVPAVLPTDGYIEVTRVTPGSPSQVRFVVEPPSGTPANVQYRGRSVPVTIDPATDAVYARVGDLPEQLRRAPGDLGELAGTAGRDAGGDEFGIGQALESGDRPRIAELITEHPLEARQVLDVRKRAMLTQYDKFYKAGRYDEASRLLKQMLREEGDTPELILRQALADLQQGDLSGAVGLASKVAAGKPPDMVPLFDEVRQRIALNPGTQGENLENMANYLDWSHSNSGAGTMQLTSVGDRVLLRFETTHLPTTRATLDEVLANRSAAIYIQDTPGLNSVDFSPASQQSLRSLISSGRVQINRVALTDLTNYRPSMVVESETGTTLKLRVPTHAPRPSQFGEKRKGCQGADETPGGDCTAYAVVETRS